MFTTTTTIKIPSSTQPWKTATIILSCTTGLFFIILLFIIIIASTDTMRVKRAFHYAAVNDSICASNACIIMPDDTLILPKESPPSDGFSLLFAQYSADLLLRLGMFVNGKLEKLTPPPELTVIGSMNTPYGKHALWILHGHAAIEQQLWFVFRGTVTEKEWDKNFQMQQAPLTIRMANRKTSELAYPTVSTKGMHVNSIFGPKIQVHSGFFEIYQTLRGRMSSLITTRSPKTKIYIVGHSLGAAQALLSTLDLALQFPNSTFISYVFGSPRVGNNAFAHSLTHTPNIKGVFSIVNTSDIVPDVPLAVQPNVCRPKYPWTYTHAGKMLTFNANWGSWLHNHTMPIYINNLKKLDPNTTAEE